ncbi:GerMN domain-containing protein [Anaerovibrio slackiae]|uniref:GerMN domain-containing protein n=1 Tax=Anaerovibrio slackiae TaxID=2652309 RepID=UPI00386E9B9B
MRLRNILAIVLTVLCVAMLAGCDEQGKAGSGSSQAVTSESSSSSAASSAASQKAAVMDISVYYPDVNATGLVAVTKTVKAQEAEKYQAAVEALLAGTDDKKLTAVFPKKAKLRKVSVSGGVAKVDFDKNLISGFVGGSTGEEMLVGSLVNTLTEFPEIKKVQILVEGKEIDSLSGHLDLSRPVERMPELIKK